MNSTLNVLQTGYAITRCALAYGKAHLPHFGHAISLVARQALFTFDVLDTTYVAWQIQNKLYKDKKPADNKRFYIDLAIKSIALVALGALFVKGANKLLLPKLNPTDLLQSTKIPAQTLQYVAEESLEHITAVWTKPLLENLVTGLFFTRTILDLYLAYLTAAKQPLINALFHTATLFKAAHYRTLEIRHSFSYLFHTIDYDYTLDPIYTELSEKYFSLPIKKVEAIFHLNISGLSRENLIEKIQSIYDYSTNMFEKSDWDRNWISRKSEREYYDQIIIPADQGFRAFADSLANYKLEYTATLEGILPPAPVTVRLLHEDTIWQPFKGIYIFQWIPRLWIPAQKVPYSAWINVDLTLPLSRADRYITNTKWFLRQVLEAMMRR